MTDADVTLWGFFSSLKMQLIPNHETIFFYDVGFPESEVLWNAKGLCKQIFPWFIKLFFPLTAMEEK